MEFIHGINKWTWILSLISTILVFWPVIKKMRWMELFQWSLLLGVVIFFITLPLHLDMPDDSDPIPAEEKYVTLNLTENEPEQASPAVPLPEPPTLIFLGIGLGVFLWMRRKK